MAELALLPFAVEKLWNLLVRETERFQGVEKQFNGLKNDVEKLRCFLEDAEAKKHTSTTVRKAIKDIKEIVLDAEDIVETFLLMEELMEELGNTTYMEEDIAACLCGIMDIVRRLYWVSVERWGLARDMEDVSKRITQEIHNMQSSGVQQEIVRERCMPPHDERRQTFSIVDEAQPIVGMEKNIELLVGYLLDGDRSQVVSITGMGGIGKTTLARQVFNNETIKSHFPGLAWVCVSQQFERKCVWQTILRQLIRPECDVSNMREDELLEKIVRVLETQKVLIVIDDIWREGDWDVIKPAILLKKGLKVLLTSRNEEVALHADRNCVTFKPECLTSEESWDLFQKITFPIKDTLEFKIDEDMKEISKKMIKHCGGLPLAIKVLGGLLRNCASHEWRRIYESINSNMTEGFKDVFHVLCLSFEELPVYLKHCFLYLAHFPEDYEISVEKLSYYWAAERIPRPRYYDGASIREVADGCIEELVKRNMIISKRDIDTSRFETVQLHDMMREVCLDKAKEENFVETIDTTSTANSKSPCKSRRLSVVFWHHEIFSVDTEVKNPSLRTLLFIMDEDHKVTSLFFTRHKLMRVLDLSGVKFEGGKVPFSIGKLIHLRYFSLRKSNVTLLPSSMRNLKKLLYLNLDVHQFGLEFYMPNILKEMRELTFLWLPKELHNKTKLELGNLINLETLKNFSTKHGRVTDLQGMTRLRSLYIFITDENSTMETLSSSLREMRCLENLTIENNGAFYIPMNDDEEGFVWDFPHLRQLELEIYMPRLPDAQHFPSHLTTIFLRNCRLKDDPMPILEKLLHLKEINLRWESFRGRRIVCSMGGFRQLQKLQFYGLYEWEEWIVEEGSMPLLHTLKIGSCPKLKELPDVLRFMTNLEDLSVGYMGDEFKLKGHLPSHLTTISLTGCCLTEDPIPILEKLLHLKKISLHSGSFYGKRMVCSRDGFPQLQNLEFWGLDDWEEWIVEEGSMPLLHSLHIWNCPKLKEIPDRLPFITNLEKLTIYEMGDEFNLSRLEGYLPSHLTTIHLEECRLKEDPMPILEKLLHLKMVNLQTQSFCGRRMVCSRDGFPQLQSLNFIGLHEWEEWIIEEGSMPLLHSLNIWDCRKLKELPDGLRFITSLKNLICCGMAKEWKKKLSEGGEDYYKVQHIPYVIIR